MAPARVQTLKGRGAWALACVAIAISGACTHRYDVRREHVARAAERARAGERNVAVPAIDGDEETFVRYRNLRQAVGTSWHSGLPYLRMEVDDIPKTIRWIGWSAVIVTGVAFFSPVPKYDNTTLTVHVVAVGAALASVSLVIVGYLMPGPEVDGPSPGMPASSFE